MTTPEVPKQEQSEDERRQPQSAETRAALNALAEASAMVQKQVEILWRLYGHEEHGHA